MTLILSGIKKSYGETEALQALDLTLPPGIYGLLGANGSGKSTLLNIIAKIIPPSEGLVTLDPPHPILEHLGFMPQQQAVYPEMSARAFLAYMARLKRIPATPDLIESLLQKVNLQDVAHRPMGTYSGGMKQRVLLAQALIGDPHILLLDEPTAGLDPLERIRIRNLISSFAQDRVTLIATHVVSDIEAIATKVIMLKKGTVLGVKYVSEWLQALQGKVFEVLVTPEDIDHYESRCLVSNMFYAVDGLTLRILAQTAPTPTATLVQPTLEDVYLYYNHQDLKGDAP